MQSFDDAKTLLFNELSWMKLYNLTLQRPGGITHVIHGNFSGPKQQEIIVSRGCVLEVLKPDPSTVVDKKYIWQRYDKYGSTHGYQQKYFSI
ncbi:unnamed protein product [Adineta steineri]|uniref:RSE1/DDB1/CPSF1 first beta-propeller domain-containing protein n=1 Tax=Adineta steineri TaxID=433720 RepID=A0A814V3S5_9BILA|nr:unnamed protein product [Adineta steineri]